MAQALSTEQLIDRIKVLEEQSVTLRDQRDQLNQEAKEWVKKRNQLNERFKKIIEEVKACKSKRDELNRQVKDLKTRRDEAKKTLEEKRKLVADLKEKFLKLQKQVSEDPSAIKNKINELEWKIQTTPLKQKEGHQLIGQVKALESKLIWHEQAQELKTKLAELRSEIEALKARSKAAHEELMKAVKESEVYHKKMIELVKTASQVKAEADGAHKSYIKIKEKADETHRRYLHNLSQIKEIKQKIEGLHRLKQNEIIKSLEESAVNKLKKGKRLSFEEFKVLVERGAI
jgi:uncharacterized coiled-coil DUF342 family protein